MMWRKYSVKTCNMRSDNRNVGGYCKDQTTRPILTYQHVPRKMYRTGTAKQSPYSITNNLHKRRKQPMKKPETTNKEINLNYGIVNDFVVTRARCVDGKNGQVIFFTLTLNEVAINNCRVAEGKNGDFISLPQYKGNDGKYYSHVFFRFFVCLFKFWENMRLLSHVYRINIK